MATAWRLLKDTFAEWSDDNASRLAAALAYYTVFAIAPLLVIAIAIAGLLLGQEAATNQVSRSLSSVFGQTAGDAVNGLVESARNRVGAGIVATIIGVITLLFGASGVFGELQNALNTIWEVAPKPNQGFMQTIRKRFFSFSMVVGVGFLLLVSLVVSAAISAFGEVLGGDQFAVSLIGQVTDFVVSFGVTTLLFALIFKVLPDVTVQWRDVWIGAVVTALLFTVGKSLLGWYLGRASTTSAYGAAGSFVALLLWVYYSAQILFFGAEFTQVYARAHGARIVPDEDAVALTEVARAQQGIPHEGALDRVTERQGRQGWRGEDDMANPLPTQSTTPRVAGVAAVGAFVIGLVVGRKKRCARREGANQRPNRLKQEGSEARRHELRLPAPTPLSVAPYAPAIASLSQDVT